MPTYFTRIFLQQQLEMVVIGLTQVISRALLKLVSGVVATAGLTQEVQPVL
jgi:hypothetical protein